ncbi:hypothetical protein QFC24_005327 [Naganishia onofrii]|uniref:Uncharacterized protein n=1 Tax=Naganishia onofrii TaxID=1851511 RepID=A0ACC2XBD8_9TREE|nr:hypothetical protein QFC24_005327 [Naganishia onofrii]
MTGSGDEYGLETEDAPDVDDTGSDHVANKHDTRSQPRQTTARNKQKPGASAEPSKKKGGGAGMGVADEIKNTGPTAFDVRLTLANASHVRILKAMEQKAKTVDDLMDLAKDLMKKDPAIYPSQTQALTTILSQVGLITDSMHAAAPHADPQSVVEKLLEGLIDRPAIGRLVAFLEDSGRPQLAKVEGSGGKKPVKDAAQQQGDGGGTSIRCTAIDDTPLPTSRKRKALPLVSDDEEQEKEEDLHDNDEDDSDSSSSTEESAEEESLPAARSSKGKATTKDKLKHKTGEKEAAAEEKRKQAAKEKKKRLAAQKKKKQDADKHEQAGGSTTNKKMKVMEGRMLLLGKKISLDCD